MLVFPCPYRAAKCCWDTCTQGGAEYRLPWAKIPCPYRANKLCPYRAGKGVKTMFKFIPFTKLGDLCQSQHKSKTLRKRRLTFEALENREFMSASPLGMDMDFLDEPDVISLLLLTSRPSLRRIRLGIRLGKITNSRWTTAICSMVICSMSPVLMVPVTL